MTNVATSIRLAVEGCGHGTLHAIYASVAESCRRKGWPGVDLLIIGGDFQAVRNAYDLHCVSMPAKYREMCDFHEYYSGRRRAPYLTVFVGGNHEASNYLSELYYGGWVAPNIYYMGAANVVSLGGVLRIAGMSGIWKGFDYRKPHLERLPYSASNLKSIYHIRELDVRKLLQVRTQVDIGVSHDWPQGVEWKGNWQQLFRWKKFLEDDARSGRLGSVAAKQVLEWLRPRKWFSAHLHVKYAAVVEHGDENVAENRQASAAVPQQQQSQSDAARNEDEIDLDMDDDDTTQVETAAAEVLQVNADEIDLELEDVDDNAALATVAPGQGHDDAVIPSESATQDQVDSLAQARAALPASFAKLPVQPRQEPEPIERPAAITNQRTDFLSLDKCLANRDFLQLLTIDTTIPIDRTQPLKLCYDAEWLAITRAFALHEPPVFGEPSAQVPRAKSHAEYARLIDKQTAWVQANIADLTVPENFEVVAPVYDDGDFRAPQYAPEAGGVREYPNSQTAAFCTMLQIPNALAITEEKIQARMEAGPIEDPENGGGFRGSGRGGRGGTGGFRGGGRGGRGGGRGRGGRGRAGKPWK